MLIVPLDNWQSIVPKEMSVGGARGSSLDDPLSKTRCQVQEVKDVDQLTNKTERRELAS